MKVTKIIFLLILISSTLYSAGNDSSISRTEEESFQLIPMVQNLEHPWSLAFLPDKGGILITERTGTLYRYKEEKLEIIKGLPAIAVIGQGGLLDVLVDINFRENNTIYFSYSESGQGGYGTVVARAVLNGLDLENLQIIFRASPKSQSSVHFGSRLLMTDSGFLYITLGEKGSMNNAQDLNHHGGSVIRINTDGTIPGDNPFAGDNNARPEIFTYGHRNAQGLAYNQERNEIWLHEHGPKGGDEVNIIKKGANYGWPLVTYGINYNGSVISNETSGPGFEDPVTYWVPSIAPSGMTFYYGDKFPQWRGNLFVGALAGKQLRRLILDGDKVVHQEILLKNKIGRIRDVRTGPDGHIYMLTDSPKGVLYRIEPPVK